MSKPKADYRDVILRRDRIFAQVTKDMTASLAAAEKSFAEAHAADTEERAVAQKVVTATAAVRRHEYGSAGRLQEAEESLKEITDRSSDAYKHGTRRKREATLAAAILELRAMLADLTER